MSYELHDYQSAKDELAADLFHAAYGTHDKQRFSDMPQYIQDMWRTHANALRSKWAGNPFFAADEPGIAERSKKQVIFEIGLPKGVSHAEVKQRLIDILNKITQETERLVNTEAPEKGEALFSGRDRNLGYTAFRSFAAALGGSSLVWDNLSEKDQEAWCAAAIAVRQKVCPNYDMILKRNAALDVELTKLRDANDNLQDERNKYASEISRLQAEYKATNELNMAEIRELEETRKRLLAEINYMQQKFSEAADLAIASVIINYNDGSAFIARPNNSIAKQEPVNKSAEPPDCKCGHDKMNHYAGFGSCDVKGCACAAYMEPAPETWTCRSCAHPKEVHHMRTKPHVCKVTGCYCKGYEH